MKTAVTMVMEFTGGVFLANYSLNAIAAVLPAGIAAFLFLAFFGSAAGPALMEMGRSLLHIVAIYLFMDAMYMSFVGVLKGAEDTRFVMWSVGGAGLFIMTGPLYVGIQLLQMGVVYAWLCVPAFITSLFLLSFYRYRQGEWKPRPKRTSLPLENGCGGFP
jgi:multidrug resistance protein, MATE family